MIEFHLDARSGVPTYLQLVQQVTQAVRLGILQPGRPAADREGGRRQPRDQPEHGAQGLPRARPRGARRGPARAWDVRLERRCRPCRRTTSRRCARRSSAGSRARARAGLDDESMAALVRRHAAAAGVAEGRMSGAALRADGLGKRYGSTLGAARLHARDPRGLGDRARRAERRRQDDPAAARRRPEPSRARASVRVLRALAARDAAAVLPRDRVRRAGPPALPRLHDRARRSSSAAGSTRAGTTARARDRIERLGLPLGKKVGKLSGGQQAQVALTLALAKRPELLLLDEPVASLDPLARREFLQSVMEAVAETGHDRRALLAHRRRPRAGLRPPRDPLAGAGPARRADRRDRREPPAAHRPAHRSRPPSRACTR